MTAPPRRTDLDAELDRLFALPASEFVAARDALAHRLTASGERDRASEVKAWKKPSTAAWAVNQLSFAAPRLLEDLYEAGRKLRSHPADLASAMQARRDALHAARRKAEELLGAAGHAATPALMKQVTATLEALAVSGRTQGGPVAGRLTKELSPPGFEELASLGLLVAPPPKPAAREKSRAENPERRERAKEARRTLAGKERALEAARGSLARAEKDLASARRKREELEKALADSKREELSRAEAASAARSEVQAAEKEAKTAAEASADAEALLAALPKEDKRATVPAERRGPRRKA